ncbi:MAG: acyloxyacyl hydrolase [Phycisphaeraceae bacterium]|nr:acyloxyacyl hydrolase [Phycisphaeraceae bacterium]
MVRLFIAGVAVFAGPAAADELFDERAARTIESRPETAELGSLRLDGPAFGTKGTEWWTFGGGIADDLSESTDYNLRVAWSHFVATDVEFSLEANGWYFDQKGTNTFGINPAFVFRWHFYNEGDWTIYGDVGIGFLLTTDDTPDKGTSFNFTPRIGAGVTYRVSEDVRLQFGLRWHHISNARLEGDSENPARDGVLLYAGVMIPF